MSTGSDFLQRIAAFLMVHMLYEVPSVSALGITPDVAVNELRFQTNESIEDLVLMTSQGRFFIQAKPFLSLSDCTVSEYSSVLRQFIDQFYRENVRGDRYIIATSSRAEQSITQALKKLTEASRINGAEFYENRQSAAEQEVLSKTLSLLEFHFKNVTGFDIEKRVLVEIFTKIHVAVIDIEEGQPLEQAVMRLLAEKSGMNAQQVWESMISMCANGNVKLTT